MLSLDTETTGKDLHHGARPFLVTLYDEATKENTFYEWDVNPLTREPQVPQEDLDEIKAVVLDSDEELSLQNPKFDVAALHTLDKDFGFKWRWKATYDTLLAGHLLASNQPHDLTSMALIYLGINILPLEQKLEAAVQEARRLCRSRYKDWMIAKEGLSGMPSAKSSNKGARGDEKDKLWKFDMWLPRAIAQEENYPDDHPWWTLTSDYANADSSVTLPLFRAMEDKIKERSLWDIYLLRLKLLPVSWKMEQYGVSVSKERKDELYKRFVDQAEQNRQECITLADGEIEDLPVNGRSNALSKVIFEKFKLKANKATPSGAQSMDKNVLEYWLGTLDEDSKPYKFISNLKAYRKKKTAVSYLDSYEKFWLPTGVYNAKGEQLWYLMHPSLNPTGTDTLRWSSSNPNEQNISKQDEVNLRYAFGPPPGREWWSLDASNIELRIPAYEAKETIMIGLFENPTAPPYYGSNHSLNFSTVYPKIWEMLLKEVGPEKVARACKDRYKATWHQWCKNGGFAVQYGAMQATADAAFHAEKYSNEFNGGKQISCYDLIKAKFNRLDAHNRWCIKHAETYGYIETIPDKTIDPERGYPLLCTRSEYGRILPTVPLNYRTQGTAMWWMGKAMVRCDNFLEQLNGAGRTFSSIMKRSKREAEKAGYHLVMQVHDELVFDFPKGEGDEPWKTNLPIIERIRQLMVQGGDDIGIPTPVNCEYHASNWAEGMPVYTTAV